MFMNITVRVFSAPGLYFFIGLLILNTVCYQHISFEVMSPMISRKNGFNCSSLLSVLRTKHCFQCIQTADIVHVQIDDKHNKNEI